MTQNNGLIKTLPTEIFHRIFDYLNVQTILLSIRYVCRQLNALTNTYDRYDLNLNLISKVSFIRICHLIQPESIISLTFADDDKQPGQFELFLSLVNIQKLRRIRSLTFLGIDEITFHGIVNTLNIDLLHRFTIKIIKYDERRWNTTNKILTRICSRVNLYNLDLNIENRRLKTLIWPLHCSIKKLTINDSMDFDYICQILKCSPQLKIFVLNYSLHSMLHGHILTSTLSPLFQQLISLTIEHYDTAIETLESFLKLMPSLIHLKLIGESVSYDHLDGYRWEQFIEKNLPKLNKFEFFFVWSHASLPILDHIERLITHYRSLFWIETKQCCISNFKYEISPHKILLSNPIKINRNNLLITDYVDTLCLTLNEELANYLKDDSKILKKPLFHKATKLNIDLPSDQVAIEPYNISQLIDFSKIIEIKLKCSSSKSHHDRTVWMNLSLLISLASNLSSLIILDLSDSLETLDTEHVLSMIPPGIKNLQMSINDLDQTQMIIQQCSLSWAKFDVYNQSLKDQLIAWLNKCTGNSTYKTEWGMISIWFGTKQNAQLSKLRTRHKRIKLSNHNRVTS
ncbi:unnamed protein product [Rotaria sordida]|uniref:F-box domain-containing protein n=1 Tax=Rotaria sordida TaxID=392033 RepID=A0A815JZE2_9BILA|nr:unnamed protein product [Rotaria sordida]CAF3901197.1 unnamed protein product [Rotaria sordida]